ncbi:MAG: sensor histidine kinase [Oceanicoccus sp.]
MTINTESREPQEFFVPDLCNAQAVLFLVLVAELLAIVLELASTGIRGFGWQSFSLTSLFIQWAFLMSAALLCLLRPRLAGWAMPRAAAVCYLLIVAVVATTSIAGQWLLRGIFNENGDWSVDLPQLTTHVLICAVLAGIALRYFYLTQQLREKQRTELQARIQALQSRIRPHFLFNSMNIIASLIAVDQEAAEMAVEDLAGLFRASLADIETEVTLADELELCRRYARIEKLRMGERLQMTWRVDNVPTTLAIPSLSLQPLLENAIYHGIQKRTEGGEVIVEANLSEGMLTLTVTNPLATSAVADEGGNRLAQDNIHHRLQALYGVKAGLRTLIENNEYRAQIYYPIENGAHR